MLLVVVAGDEGVLVAAFRLDVLLGHQEGRLHEAARRSVVLFSVQNPAEGRLARKTHKKASKAASYFCKVLVVNKLNFAKRTPLR